MSGFVCAFSLALGLPGDAPADSCVSPRALPPQSISAIRIVPLDFPPALAAIVDAAMSAWNHPSCNTAGGFPRFEYDTRLPHRVLTVRFVAGESPGASGRCGSFVGTEVRIYSHARDPRDGVLRTCGDRAHLLETLVHEFGHVLGLEDQYDSSCSGYIMGQLVRTPRGELLRRSLRRSECVGADTRFLTLAERGRSRFEGDALAGLEDDRIAAGDSPSSPAGERRASRPLFRLPEESARSLPRFARTVRGSLVTGSAAYRL